MNNVFKWTGALLFSLGLHGGAFLILPESEPQPPMTEGGIPIEMTSLGSTMTETLEAGDDVQEIEPDQVQEVVEEVAQETLPDVAQPQPLLPPLDAPVVEQAEVAAAAEQPEIGEPEKVEEEPQPEPPPVVKPKPKPEPKKEKPRKKPVEVKRRGDKGDSKVSDTLGTADGVEGAPPSASGGNQAGNARVKGDGNITNFQGKIRRKIDRAKRYPTAARRDRLRGIASVAFTVSASGSPTNIRLARSSGSPILDQEALATVRRAGPFASPQEVGRESYPFVVPLDFTLPR